MNIINGLSFLAPAATCELTGTDADGKILIAIRIARMVVQILQVAVPVGLIIWGTLDFGKAVIEGDEKKMKEKRKPFIQRVISAVIVFLIPWFTGVILGNVGGSTWKECWAAAKTSDVSSIFGGDKERDPMSVEEFGK